MSETKIDVQPFIDAIDGYVEAVAQLTKSVVRFSGEFAGWLRCIAREVMVLEGWTPWVASLRAKTLPMEEIMILAEKYPERMHSERSV